MREYLSLMETPINDFQLHGDFSKNGTYFDKDRVLVSNPKHQLRLTKLLNKTPFKINVVLWNIAKKNKLGIKPEDRFDISGFWKIRGEYSNQQVKSELGLDLKEDSSAITFVLCGNNNGEHTLSAWMLVHRFMHIIEDAYDSDKHSANEGLRQAYHTFSRLIEERKYGKFGFIDLLTTKSASNMPNEEEVTAELMTQYLVKGRVTLKGSDDEQAIMALQQKMNDILHQLFLSCIGRVYVSV